MRERLILDAVMRNFVIIGEAAGRISPSLRDTSGFPWAKVVAFRNRLIHGYWSVDLRLVRDVPAHEVPAVETTVDLLAEFALDN